MPYIDQEKSDLALLYKYHEVINPAMINDAGQFNFALTKLIVGYIENKGLRYQHINDVMGAGIGSLLEFYIRIVRPYEDLKIEENGDVYGPLLKLLAEAKEKTNGV